MIATSTATRNLAPGQPHLARVVGKLSGQRALAVLIALFLGVRSPIASWLSIGALLCLLFLPVTIAGVRRKRGWTLLVLLTAFAALWGVVLSAWSLAQDPARTIDSSRQLFDIGSLVGLLVMVLAGMWCIRVLGASKFLMAWAVGMIPVAVWGNSVFANNPWKFGLALPVSLLVIIVLGVRFRTSMVLAITLIGAVSFWFGYRSWLAIVLVAFISVLIFRQRSEVSQSKLRYIFKFSLLLTSAWILSDFLLQLVLNGALGRAVQERTQLQIAWGDGNLVLGARAEWGAALGLFQVNAFGFGTGVTPSNTDWMTAIRSLSVPEGLQEVSNVSTYFKAGIIEFHSVFWNFWSHYGWAGIILWLAIVVVLVGGFLVGHKQGRLRYGQLAQSTLILAVLWDLLFSPTVLPNIAAALAISLSLLSRNVRVQAPASSATAIAYERELRR